MSNAASSADSATPDRRPAGPVIALVAGEASGDLLGGSLITALRRHHPDARFVGMGGASMEAAGLECWRSSDELSVMGLFEVLAHLPRLLRLRRWLADRLLRAQPDVLVGIDAPDFNLGLERRLRAAGIPTAHYVSPTIWAWRKGRVRTIAASADQVLCLFPFEPPHYEGYPVTARYTGHPMADEIPLESDRAAARKALGLPAEGRCIALLPGSRTGEVSRLAGPLLDAAARLCRRYPETRFVAPMARAGIREVFSNAASRYPDLPLTLVDGGARSAMAASDLVLCASGTATLEAMLVKRPMVVVYRFSAMTYRLATTLRLYKPRFFSLPNLLADRELVPELLQHEVTGERIEEEAARWLDHPRRMADLEADFRKLHVTLRRDAAATAANCVAELLKTPVGSERSEERA